MIAPETLSMGISGGMQTVAVETTAADTAWTARSECQWLAVDPMCGSGGGRVTIFVAPHCAVGRREGLVIIGGRTLNVVQEGYDMRLVEVTGS